MAVGYKKMEAAWCTAHQQPEKDAKGSVDLYCESLNLGWGTPSQDSLKKEWGQRYPPPHSEYVLLFIFFLNTILDKI